MRHEQQDDSPPRGVKSPQKPNARRGANEMERLDLGRPLLGEQAPIENFAALKEHIHQLHIPRLGPRCVSESTLLSFNVNNKRDWTMSRIRFPLLMVRSQKRTSL